MPRTIVTTMKYIRTVPGSVVLNGIDQYFTLGNAGPSAQELTSFSMCGWVKRDKTTGITALFGNNNNASQTNFNFQIQGANRKALTTIVTNIGPRPLVGVNNIGLGTWTHMGLNYDGANINWYINGFFDNTTTHSGTIAAATTGTLIGTSSAPIGGVYRFLGGYMCELRFWNSRVLTANDFSLLAAGTPDSSLRTGLANEWNLYTDGNDTLGVNNGTPVGSPTYTSLEVPCKDRSTVNNRVPVDSRTFIN